MLEWSIWMHTSSILLKRLSADGADRFEQGLRRRVNKLEAVERAGLEVTLC